MKKVAWLYQLRAIAIFAVVVCHQQKVLHTSETIQMITLYSVTTLIFLMGITQAFSLKKHASVFKNRKICSVMLEKMLPVLGSYIVVTIAYLMQAGMFVGYKYEILAVHLLNFSAAGPLYFVEYYIWLTLVSPIIFVLIKAINIKNHKIKILEYVLIVVVFFVIGYVCMGKLEFLGGSFLSVYAAGMIWGYEGISMGLKRISFPVGCMALVLGFFSTKMFYANKLRGGGELIGIDKLVPKLSMRPPNLSIILYSAGIIIVGSIILDIINRKCQWKLFQYILKLLEVIGTYSLDIFLWHLFIQRFLINNFVFENIWIKRCVFYFCMIIIPIVIRMIYMKIKGIVYSYLSNEEYNTVERK